MEVRGPSAGFLLPSCGLWEVKHGLAGEAPWQPCLLNFLLDQSTGTLRGTSQGIPTKPKPHSVLSSCMHNGRSRTHPNPSHAAVLSRLDLRALFPCVHSLPLSASPSQVLCFSPQSAVQAQLRSTTFHKAGMFSSFPCLGSGMSAGHGPLQRPAWRSLLSSL